MKLTRLIPLLFIPVMTFRQEGNIVLNNEVRLGKDTEPVKGIFRIDKEDEIYNEIDSSTYFRISSLDPKRIEIELKTKNKTIKKIFKGRYKDKEFKTRG